MKQLILFFILASQITSAQSFVAANPSFESCMVNVNDNRVASFREDLKRSVFQYAGSGAGSCTGTLINRNTSESDLGQYFITSWHCFKSGSTCGGSEFDFNKEIEFSFNYQSPSNQLGKVLKEIQDQYIENGIVTKAFKIRRKVRLVDKVSCGYGDFALCEILGNPIPPHFTPYFAGWSPFAPLVPAGDYITIGHSNASLKEASKTNYMQNGLTTYSPKKACDVVTKLVDFLFGWIWGRKWSTQVICQYVQIPFLDTRFVVFGYGYGATSEGASGSSIFNGNNRVLGTLSGSAPDFSCNGGIDYFGKLPDYYYRAAIKNVLNPANKWRIDESGIPGRNKNCYQSINYNYGQSFDFYPAAYYQNNNSITLNSQTDVYLGINSANTINIKSGADFTFNAGGIIDLGSNFEVESGATFTANAGVSACGFSGNYRTEVGAQPENEGVQYYEELAQLEIYAKLNAIEIPDDMDLPATLQKNKVVISASPNPVNDLITLSFSKITESEFHIEIIDAMGQSVFSKTESYAGQKVVYLPTLGLINGIYQILFSCGETKAVEKILITH